MADSRLDEEIEAWNEYQESTSGLAGTKYEEVEPWAWTKLQKQLLTIHKRRPKVA